jgi:hypothetical protein
VIEERLFELMDPVLLSAGTVIEAGEDFRQPSLDVLRYYRRSVKWNRVPLFAWAQSLVAVVRQPLDIEFSEAGYHQLLIRVARAASGRFPPHKGLVIGLTALVLTTEPIGPGDDAVLARVLGQSLHRFRVVPFGLIKVSLGQEAVTFALRPSPGQLFPEPVHLADALCEHLRRYLPAIEM